MLCKQPFHRRGNYPGVWHKLGCGRCLYCRIQRRREWTIRLLHEAYYHKDNMFITLTYAEDPVTLVKKDLQDFFKRYRRYLDVNFDKNIKYYAVGEYGEKHDRPHYHAIIFNDFRSSSELESLWTHGMVDVGFVTQDSIRYVAGYVEKKLTGALADQTYGDRIQPYSVMSKGLGYQFFVDNIKDILDDKAVYFRGRRQSIPRYYLKRLSETDPEAVYRLRCEKTIASFEKSQKTKEYEARTGKDMARDEHFGISANQLDKNLKAKHRIRELKRKRL